MEKKFKKVVRCGTCRFEEVTLLDKIEAMFDHATNIGESCKKCGGRIVSSSKESPNIDSETLELWIKDSRLMLLEQDEDIILSGKENYDIVLMFIDREDALLHKRLTLLASLCIYIYDNAMATEKDKELDLYAKSIREVSSRMNLIENKDSFLFIDPYIRKVVWPLIGLSWV